MLKKGTKAIVIGLVVLLLFLGLWYINRPEEGFLGQDLSLIDSNGRIVYLEPLTIKSEYAGRVEYYRLRYLSDGLNVVGFLMKPKGTGVYPAIIYNRGGSLEYFKIDASRLRVLSFLPANGYVVVATQYRGNDDGEGREEYGGSDVNDVLNLLPLLESLPFVDSDRIGMYGWSRGGMETYIAITRTDKIKAAVVGGGITDLIQTFEERPKLGQLLIRMIGGSPDETEKEYKNRSAFYWPEQISIPILILHGDADERVNVTQAKKLASELGDLGKTYESVIYPGEDHGLSEYRQDVGRRILEWFAKYV